VAGRISSSGFRARAAEVVGRLRFEVGAFGPEAPAKAERLARAKADPFYFCQNYLPHYFSQPFAAFHHELIELIAPRHAAAVTPVAVAAPRGFAKTTVVSFGYVLHQALFGLRRFVVLGSDTADLAGDLCNYIRLEMTHNPRLQQDFGALASVRGAADDFVTGADTRILARGSGQRLRGLKHGRHRPDLVILDDLENDKNVQNPRLVRESLAWVLEAVYPAIDPGGSLLIIGTILAQRSALATMIHSSRAPWRDFTRRLYRAIQADGTSLWPQRHRLEDLLRQKQLMGSRAFNKEKQNEPRDDEGMFQERWIRPYAQAELAGKRLAVAAFLDPSLATGETGDYKALITVGLDQAQQVFYVLDAFIRRCSLDQLLRAAIARHRRHGFLLFGVEDNFFQRLLLDELARAARQEGVSLPLRGVTQRLAKQTRLAGLSPLVERGALRFLPDHSDQALLIEQLLHFPSPGVHDDGPDALEGAVGLLRSTGPNVW